MIPAVKLGSILELDRCPHCGVDRPNLSALAHSEGQHADGTGKLYWQFYRCARCGWFVSAASPMNHNGPVVALFPPPDQVDEALPARAQGYLKQAMDTLNAPAGAVMLSASAVDAMLKAKEYKSGSLYERIDKAAKDHLITADMARWAHQVRLDANDERHADDETPMATKADAERSVEFARALGEFMFVLPARVTRGLAVTKPK